jgi:SAM-dependent methyltransferase
MSAPSTSGAKGFDTGLVDKYFEVMGERVWSSSNLRFYLGYLFDDVDLGGKRMLDVGAGDGRYSLFAACQGAARVVSLEPQGAGSRADARRLFEAAAKRLDVPNVTLLDQRLGDFDAPDQSFDVVLLHASINHLDEDATIRLADDRQARDAYLSLFSRLARLAAPGAKLIAVDVSSRNLFARFGKNPIVPAIEWEKHQPPEVWASVLAEVGFTSPRIRWNSFNSLRSAGRFLLGNRVAAYCLTSNFCLTMERR